MTNGKISIKDVYVVVNRVEDQLTDILNKHDERILDLERGQANAQGIGMGISFLTALLTSLAGIFWFRK